MSSKIFNKDTAMRAAAFIAVCYILCCLFDYMLFDYAWDFIVVKQIISCALMACFVLFCIAMGKAGYVLFTLFCFLCSVLVYAHHAFGYTVTYDGVAALFETNTRELGGFMTPGLVGLLAVAVLAPAGVFFLLRKIVRPATWRARLVMGLCAVAGFVFLFNVPWLAYKVHPSVYKRTCSLTHKALPEMYETGHYELSAAHMQMPFSNLKAAFGMMHRYWTQPLDFDRVEDAPSQCDELLQNDLVIVLVIGESVRADHCSFNGYGRPTMEQVSETPGVVVLPDMWSFGPSTYVSLEGIFGGLHVPETMATHTSFAGLFRKHGYHTHFVAENTEDSLTGQKLSCLAGYAFNRRESCFMPILDLADRLGKDLEAPRGKGYLLVVENGTGHFPYAVEEQHRLFRPDKGSGSITDCDNEMIVNTYDNCIHSVDLFLARLMDSLKDKKAVLIYTSDHGQRLGEGGSWAHGVACREVQHVGAFMWFSPAYEAACPEYVAELKAAAAQPHCHGQIFATLLKLGGITTEAPLETQDLTHPAPETAPVHLQGWNGAGE